MMLLVIYESTLISTCSCTCVDERGRQASIFFFQTLLQAGFKDTE